MIKKPVKIRVAHVFEEGRFCGPQSWIALISKQLKSLGVETVVYFPSKDSEKFSNLLKQNEVKGVVLDLTRLSKEKGMPWRYVKYFLWEIVQLSKAFREDRIDLVNVHGAYQFKGAIAAKLAGIPVVWTLNDCYMPTLIKSIFTLLARVCADGFISAGLRVYDYYIGQVGSLRKKPYIETQAPIDVEKFNPAGTSPDERITQRGGLKILTVANVSPGKGYEIYIEMAIKLSEKYPNLSFFIAGAIYSSQVDYYEFLKTSIRQAGLTNVHFLGAVDNIPSILKAADIFVCPSFSEGTPTTVWEAMFMAKAIITTDVGDVKRYIADGQSGFVTSVGDVGMLSAKVSTFIENDNLRKKCGDAARDVALRDLHVDICTLKHGNFYRSIVMAAQGIK